MFLRFFKPNKKLSYKSLSVSIINSLVHSSSYNNSSTVKFVSLNNCRKSFFPSLLSVFMYTLSNTSINFSFSSQFKIKSIIIAILSIILLFLRELGPNSSNSKSSFISSFATRLI